jgi:hypothetical protein
MMDHAKYSSASRSKSAAISFLVLIWGLLVFSAAPAEIYKVVDKDGNVSYTDQPPADGSEPVKLRGLSVIAPQKPATAPVTTTTPGEEVDDVSKIRDLRRGYRDFSLVSPSYDQIFSGTGNVATVAWSTRYHLQPGMHVVLYIDGEAQPPITSTMINTPRLNRGEHEVYAELIDSRNRRIASTEPVKFFIQQPSVNFGNAQAQGN